MKQNYNYVFTYGSLMQGYWNNRMLEGSPMIGYGKTKHKYQMTWNGGYPAIKRSLWTSIFGKGVQVKGEIYQVTDKILATLDTLEAVPWLYKRVEAQIEMLCFGVKVIEKCWVYVGVQAGSGENWTPIPSGDYTRVKQPDAIPKRSHKKKAVTKLHVCYCDEAGLSVPHYAEDH